MAPSVEVTMQVNTTNTSMNLQVLQGDERGTRSKRRPEFPIQAQARTGEVVWAHRRVGEGMDKQ